MAVIGNSSTQQAFTPAVDYFSGNASTTAFTLSRPVASVAQVQVVVNNVAQNPSSAYTVSSNTITFTSAPSSGTNNIYVYYTSPITDVIAPGQGTVTTTSLASSTGTGAVVLATSPTITTPTVSGDATISGLTVGKGGGGLSQNTVVGNGALAATNTGNRNTAIGANAGAANTSGHITAVGAYALNSNTTGNSNTAVGGNDESTGAALQFNTTGSSNTAVGVGSLFNNTTTSQNTAVGYQALYNNTAGSSTAVGYQALYAQTSPANFNDAFGNGALKSLTTGNINIGLGTVAGQSITTGGGNICLGHNSGLTLATGSTNVYLGYAATASSASVSSEIVVGGNVSTGKGVNTGFINPSGANYQGNNSASWSTTSDQRLKKNIVDNTEGLDVISQIRVRNFEYRMAEEVTELPAHTVIDKQGVQLGVIAQELQQVCSDCVKEESTGVLSVDASNLTWHMINAIKDLKTLNDTQAETINALTARIEALENK